MHVETRAMSDKYWMSDWLANDVIGMGIDVRIPIASVLRTGYHFKTYCGSMRIYCMWGEVTRGRDRRRRLFFNQQDSIARPTIQ